MMGPDIDLKRRLSQLATMVSPTSSDTNYHRNLVTENTNYIKDLSSHLDRHLIVLFHSLGKIYSRHPIPRLYNLSLLMHPIK